MPNDDTALFDWRDVPASVGLLTRLPIQVDDMWASKRGARAAWAYPVVGLVLGLGFVVLGYLFQQIGLSAMLVSALALSIVIFCTGALHEDGLADSFDGLWGGWEPARRLEIMKDSHIGTYGVLALALSLIIRWQGYSALIEAGFWVAIISALTASRAVMPILMQLPHARTSGLSAHVGTPPPATSFAAAFIGLLSLAFIGWVGVIATAAVCGVCVMVWRTAMAKIQGQTGDILGASQVLTECAILLAVCAVL